jgi:hypothetical protein
MPKWPFNEVPDHAGLTDADWAEINKLKAAFETGGAKAFDNALKELLAADPVRCYKVTGALFPKMLHERACRKRDH